MNGTAWIGYHTILLTKHNHHRQLQQPRFLLERKSGYLEVALDTPRLVFYFGVSPPRPCLTVSS